MANLFSILLSFLQSQMNEAFGLLSVIGTKIFLMFTAEVLEPGTVNVIGIK